MNATTEKIKKKRAGRSPGYPGIDVQTALKRAQELYDKAQHHSSHIEIVSKHWGYKAASGLGAVIVAALIRYGFVVGEGSGKDRKIRLTDLALGIIKDKRGDSTERDQKIIQAALSPKIHAEMLKMYGVNLPSDEDLLYEMEMNKGFTPNGAKDFISQYKRTLSFISGLESDIIPPSDGDSEQQNNQPPPNIQTGVMGTPATNKGGKVQTIQIPMLEGTWPSFTAEFPMTKEKWDYMMDILKKMESQLVKSESPKSEKGEEAEE